MQKRMLEYDDPWKRFKMLALSQIDYLTMEDKTDQDHLLDEIHPHMRDEFFEEGTQIIA